ncbi:MAG: hypothetical protein M1812_000343 [Candelaria pacifica]|nr:MAG: hypothetical protein M1812_000343 [Candelaria pacifica]
MSWRLAQGRDLSSQSWLRRLGKVPARPRNASTLASVTTVNAPKVIRSELRPLHEALNDVKARAANYVNLSRLRLALRGLEGENPVVRVAVLGINNEPGVHQLVRLLMADPLAAEGGWEKQLQSLGQDDGRGLLLRYGDTTSVGSENPPLQTLSIPSTFLSTHNLEFLITSLNTNATASAIKKSTNNATEAVLVPPLEAPGSGPGRSSTIAYPVHMSLVYGQGIESGVTYARYTAGKTESESHRRLLKVALDLPAPENAPAQDTQCHISLVNVELANNALDKFRESLDNAVAYEHGWLRSGMPALTAWLSEGTQATDSAAKPAVKNLISSILNDTTARIVSEDAQRSQDIVKSSVSDETRESLGSSLKTWAENAHTELRDQLDIAFHGNRWRKLRWWKLFWRVDDVGMIASELLERRWLVEAEKEIIWVSGRISEAMNKTNSRLSTSMKRPTSEPRIGSTPPPPEVSDLAKQIPSDSQMQVPVHRLWPLDISIARMNLSTATVPLIETLAMTLVPETLATTVFTSALSGLLYFSISTTSIYEVGAIAALGFVWSMRRLQRKWEAARMAWEGEVREEGRRVLRETEMAVGVEIRDTGRPKSVVEGEDDRRAASEAVERARQALEDLR